MDTVQNQYFPSTLETTGASSTRTNLLHLMSALLAPVPVPALLTADGINGVNGPNAVKSVMEADDQGLEEK